MRRQTPVLRNLSDPLRFLGLVSVKGAGLLYILGAGLYTLELLGAWNVLGEGVGFLVPAGLFAAAFAGLVYAERQDDEHLVPAMLAFTLRREEGKLYGGAKTHADNGWAFEWVLSRRDRSS